MYIIKMMDNIEIRFDRDDKFSNARTDQFLHVYKQGSKDLERWQTDINAIRGKQTGVREAFKINISRIRRYDLILV